MSSRRDRTTLGISTMPCTCRSTTVERYLYADWEDEPVQALASALGRRPCWAVQIDISGRAYGIDKARRLAMTLLALRGGVVMDDYGDHRWTLEQLQADVAVGGRHFGERPMGQRT